MSDSPATPTAVDVAVEGSVDTIHLSGRKDNALDPHIAGLVCRACRLRVMNVFDGKRWSLEAVGMVCGVVLSLETNGAEVWRRRVSYYDAFR